MTTDFPVVRGNCPCLRKPARELAGRSCTQGQTLCATGLFDDLLVDHAHRMNGDTGSPSVIRIDPVDLRGLYGGRLADTFIMVSSAAVRQAIGLENRTGQRIEEFEWRPHDGRARLITRFAELRAENVACDVLWIADDEFEHFLPEHISNVKLAAISFFSSPFSVAALRRYLRIIREVDYANERTIETTLIRYLDAAARIHFYTPAAETHAVFDHRLAAHWFSLNGALERGEQTVLPTGELSALTDAAGEFSLSTPFALDGELVLHGRPIVHRGGHEVTEAETADAYRAMSAMLRYPVIARVQRGVAVELRSPMAGRNPFAEALERLFSIDERYRKVHEIGFGTNLACARPADGNFFPNERCPGVHFGFGLGGHTPFHIDLACPDIDIRIELKSGRIVDLYQALEIPRIAPKYREDGSHC